MGTLIAALLIHPLDVVKTRHQVDVDMDVDIGKERETRNTKSTLVSIRNNKTHNLFVAVWLMYRQEGIDGLFAGWRSKAAHTVLSNFACFY